MAGPPGTRPAASRVFAPVRRDGLKNPGFPADAAAGAQEKALGLLDRSRKTRRELERRLRERGYEAPAIAEALDRLARVGVVDDVEYARAFVRSRLARRPVALGVVIGQLRARGVSAEDIERALAGAGAGGPDGLDRAGERNRAERALAPLVRRYRNLDPREARAKIAAALARRGFDYDTVSEVLATVTLENAR